MNWKPLIASTWLSLVAIGILYVIAVTPLLIPVVMAVACVGAFCLTAWALDQVFG